MGIITIIGDTSCPNVGTIMLSSVLLIIMPFFKCVQQIIIHFQLNSNSNSNRLTLPKLTETVGKELREPILLRLVQFFFFYCPECQFYRKREKEKQETNIKHNTSYILWKLSFRTTNNALFLLCSEIFIFYFSYSFTQFLPCTLLITVTLNTYIQGSLVLNGSSSHGGDCFSVANHIPCFS